VPIPASIGIAHRPPELGVREAGALGLAGAAALASLEAADVRSADTVLISGATGGVGSLAVQLAAARGARVIATARGGEEDEFVRGLGADGVVDYTADLAGQVGDVDGRPPPRG